MQQIELREDRRETAEVFRGRECIEVLPAHARSRLLEPIEDFWKCLLKHLFGGNPGVARALLRASVVAAEKDRAAENSLADTSSEVAFVPGQATLLLSDQRALVTGLGAALLELDHLLRTMQLNHVSIDVLIQGGDPEDALQLALTASAHLGEPGAVLTALVGQRQVKGHVAFHELPAVQRKPGLEDLGLQEIVDGLRLPEALDDVLKDPCLLRRLGAAQGQTLPFPVVLDWRWDSIAVVAEPDLVGLNELVERRLHVREKRVCVDGGVEGRGDVLGRPMDTLHVLEQTDRLGHRLGQRMIHLFSDRVDLTPDLAWDVA